MFFAFVEGFAAGLISEKAVILAKVYQSGNDNTVDSLVCPPKRKPVVTVQYDAEKKVIFLTVDDYGVPKILVPEIVDQVSWKYSRILTFVLDGIIQNLFHV